MSISFSSYIMYCMTLIVSSVSIFFLIYTADTWWGQQYLVVRETQLEKRLYNLCIRKDDHVIGKQNHNLDLAVSI